MVKPDRDQFCWHAVCAQTGVGLRGALIGWMLAYGGYDAAEKARTAPRLASLLRYSRLFRRSVFAERDYR